MIATFSLCISSVHGDNFITLDQRSEPQGIFVNQSGQYPQGSAAQTIIPPLSSSVYSFGYWTLNGIRAEDQFGQSLIQPSFTINSNATAIARYFQTSEDSNSDGVADHLQWRLYGSLTNGPTSDTDSDGFDFTSEMDRGYTPVVGDQLTDGGTMLRLSGTSAFRNKEQKKSYTMRSDPQGIFSYQSAYVDTGTPVTTPSFASSTSYSGYYFGYWTVDGVRMADGAGAALPSVELPMTSDNVAIARFFPNVDNDTDGMKDWYEWYWFGTTNQTAASDPDSDGFTIAEETERGYSPVIADALADGGMMLRLSGKSTFRDQTQKKSYTIRSDPQGIFSYQSVYVDTGTPITTPSFASSTAYNGYYFGYWEVDGVRIADGAGVALPNVVLPMSNDTIAVARFFPNADTDGDGMKDWYEWYWFGNTNQTAASDPDNDGFTIAEETERGYSPVIADALADGGMMLRLSAINAFRDQTQKKSYTIRSDPQGIFSRQSAYVDTGTPVTTPSFASSTSYSWYYFGYWEVDGVRVTDGAGVALPSVELPMTNDTVAIARFFLPNIDVDGDGMKDWYEWYWLGSLFQTLESDPDHDGLSIAEEQERGYNPVIADELSDGGTMLRLSSVHSIQFGYFPVITEGLRDGLRKTLFSANATAPGEFNFGANSHPALGDWDGDGDLDLFVGFEGGGLQIFENAGSPQTANWIDRTANFATFAHFWNSIPNPVPALGDWSGDGLADLAVGGNTNVIQLIRSDGSWTGSPPSSIQLAVSSQSAVPAFGDLNGDGLLDLLVLTDTGLVMAYTNTQTHTLPYSTTPTFANLLGTAVPNANGITTMDANGDGIVDILISDDNGSIWEFHGTTPP